MLRRVLRPKKEEVGRGLKKLHNKEFHNLYPSIIVIRLIKLSRVGM